MADFRGMAAGLDPAQLVEFSLQELLDLSDESPPSGASAGAHPAQSRAYGRDAKAMTATPADVKEAPGTYAFVVDMPGLKAEQIKVRMEEGKVLVVSGERRRERADAEQGVKYLRMERRLGKYLKKFVLPENADADKIAAEYQDGVLTVTVEKKPPPEPKKPKTIEVRVA